LVLIAVATVAAIAVVAPAHAETVSGTFSYVDSGGPRPVVGAQLDVVRGIRGFLGNWSWNRVAVATTDGDGSFSVYVSHKAKGARYRVQVYAWNQAAAARDGQGTFSRTVAADQTVQRWDDEINVERTFTGFAAAQFNLIETIRRGRDYAQAHRDPRERDRIPRASVAISPAGATAPTWYDPNADTVRIGIDRVFDDPVILHEYAHYLERHIGTFAPIPAIHDGCTAKDVVFGNVINTSEHAWMEGFADYFAQVGITSDPGADLEGPARGTMTASQLEAQPFVCALEIGGSGIEWYVAGSLWDIFDKADDPGSYAEEHDTLERLDDVVFQIFDRELGQGTWPTMYMFREAWWRRGQSSAALDDIVGHHRIAGPFLPVSGGGTTPGEPEDPPECRFAWKPCLDR
jgi:hypothetical protein